MNSFFRSALAKSRDSLVKESLQNQLASCVKDIQLDQAHSGRFVSSSEAAESLCIILEAIFIHGVKESLTDKFVIALGDPDIRPEPNFWPALMVFSHRELIDQIGKLNLISTDVGRCRAWLRMALNDGLLTSYLHSMSVQNSILTSFYKRSAYLRDKDMLDMFITLISGTEAHTFNLACNSSLLNMWTNQPLLLAGVWSPGMKSNPITRGTDIAQSLMEDDLARQAEDSVSSIISIASVYDSSFSSSAFDEEEVLKIILGSDTSKDVRKTEASNLRDRKPCVSVAHTDAKESESCEQSVSHERDDQTENGNDVDKHDKQQKRKSNFANERKNPFDSELEFNDDLSITEEKVIEESESQKPQLQTYHSLVESYNQASAATSGIPDLQHLLLKFDNPTRPPTDTTPPSDPDNNSDANDMIGFEVVPKKIFTANEFDLGEFSGMINHVTKIAREQGLDTQNYTCKSCTLNIGINFSPAKVCGLTGAYYCLNCFQTNVSKAQWEIPARIIRNWDFNQQFVSKEASEFLSQIQLYPLFDLSILNPKIYSAVEEMERLKDLRIQLENLSAYLLTCRENVIQCLKKMLWPREYLYEQIHLYSLADLMQISTGVLEVTMQKAVNFARSHVLSCTLCSQKGFICEICNNPKVIYPFDRGTNYKCKDCHAVYHAECMRAGQLCPKCFRIQQRELAIQSP